MAKSGEVLSQEQIDSLLTAIHSGNTTVQTIQKEPRQDVRLYDFRYPSKFSREHVQSFHALHEMYARLFSTQMTTQMRLPVQTEVISVDQLTYGEFMRSITNPTVVIIYNVETLKGNILFEFTPGTAISMIERLLGGPGRIPPKPRELTEIEQNLLGNVMNKALSSFREAWKPLLPNIQLVQQTLETNPRFVQIAGTSDSVLVISFEIRLGDSTGSMRICLPYPTVEGVLPQLNRQYMVNQGKEPAPQEAVPELQRHLQQVELDVSLLLGYTEITMRDLIELQVGDVLQLDAPIHQDMPLLVERSQKFWARPGTFGSRLAAQITQILEGNEEPT